MRPISTLLSATSESLVQIGPAIAKPIQDERQDSVCRYLEGSLRSPLDYSWWGCRMSFLFRALFRPFLGLPIEY